MTENQRQLLSDCSQALQLKQSPGWQVIIRDAQANFDAISNCWFNLPEGSIELREARTRQIANHTLLTLMDMYQDKYNSTAAEVMEKEDPTLFQTSDVDPGAEEDDD